MPKIDLNTVEPTNATGYPAPYDEEVKGRWYRRLAPLVGLTKMGASHVRLEPGAFSSQRHWHAVQDELVIMIEGEAILIDNDGETPVRGGDVLAFPAGEKNGHRLHNRSSEPCVFVAISAGPREDDHGDYPDIDMVFDADGYARNNGERYESERIK